jgi:hypothetical protein
MVMSKDVLSRLDVSTKQQRIARIARQKSEEPLTLLNHYYRYEVTRTWKKWLCRRSKRGYRLNWERFSKLIEQFFPLPSIKVVHSIYHVAKP